MITYRELRDHLNTLDEERIDDNVSVHLSEEGEYYPVVGVFVVGQSDVLDAGHTYLVVL